MDLDQTIKLVVLERSLSVLRSELDPADEDEEALDFRPPYKLRRAISREEARRLRNTAELEPTDSLQAHDVWYVYRDFYPREIDQHGGLDGFVVDRLITTPQFAYLMERMMYESD